MFFLDIPVPGGGRLQTHVRMTQTWESQGTGEVPESDHDNQLAVTFHGKGEMNTELDCAMSLPDCVSALHFIEDEQTAKRQRVFQ